MILTRQGEVADSSALSQLIFSTAPVLLPYLFGSNHDAKRYIHDASEMEDGQYSAFRHHVAYDDTTVVGCITTWDQQLPDSFYYHTEKSLTELLTNHQIMHIVEANEHIANVFLPPTNEQICIGHLAVLPHYRGMGIAKQLMAYAIEKAYLAKKTHLVLDVDAANEDAVCFYLGFGFVMKKETVFLPTKQTFYRMQYTLG